MAPSPVVDIEPKGPDKNTEKCADGVSHNDKPSMAKSDNGSASKDKTTVSTLGQTFAQYSITAHWFLPKFAGLGGFVFSKAR